MPEKQPDLNGAYYGPSIPVKQPKRQNYNRPGRGGGGLCCLFKCCGCCIFSFIMQIVVTVAIAVGLAIFLFWLIVRPTPLKFHVTDAQLTAFNVTSAANGASTLNYDLKLNMTFRNPNKRIGVYYDRIEARAYYEGERFDTETLTKFYLGHKKSANVSTAFQGQQLVLLSSGDMSDYEEDKAAGVYDINVRLYLRLRFKFGIIKTFKFKPKIKCGLKVPLSSGTAAATVFQAKRCDFDW